MSLLQEPHDNGFVRMYALRNYNRILLGHQLYKMVASALLLLYLKYPKCLFTMLNMSLN
jgi:hypothetical protein